MSRASAALVVLLPFVVTACVFEFHFDDASDATIDAAGESRDSGAAADGDTLVTAADSSDVALPENDADVTTGDAPVDALADGATAFDVADVPDLRPESPDVVGFDVTVPDAVVPDASLPDVVEPDVPDAYLPDVPDAVEPDVHDAAPSDVADVEPDALRPG